MRVIWSMYTGASILVSELETQKRPLGRPKPDRAVGWIHLVKDADQ
jgi:hypothetical protein